MPKGRKKGVRFSDIAAHAKVGIATVDRVLNERGNVSPETVRQVLDAAQSLGVNRRLPDAYSGHRRYRAILGRKRAPFSQQLSNDLRRAAAVYERRIILERNFVPQDDAAALGEEIRRGAKECDGLIVLPLEDDAVRAAIGEAARSIPVITIVSDLARSGRNVFVGTDNAMAGRTAAVMIGTAVRQEGKVLVFWDGPTYSGQGERVAAFRSVMAGEFAALGVEDIVVPVAAQQDTLRHIHAALRANPDLVAVYDAGVPDSAIPQAIKAARQGGDVFCIAHELTPTSTKLLRERVIDYLIDQNPAQIARTSVEALMHRDGLLSGGAAPDLSDMALTEFKIYCRANVPGG